MKPARLLLFSLAALAVLVFSARFLLAVKGAAGGGGEAACLELEATEVGRPAPGFALEDLAGRPVRLADHRGEVVLLNFWATWCPPCVEELPSLARLRRRMAGKGLATITVSVDQSADEVRGFLAKQPGGVDALPVALDPERRVPASYGTEKFPETFLIDRRGIIRYKMIYKRDWAGPAALRCIESLL